MKGYIYLLNGKPVINEQEKPEYPQSGRYISRYAKIKNAGKYNQALKEWEANCIPVGNADKVIRCWKCGTIGILIEGELPIMCTASMPVRTSGICGGSYNVFSDFTGQNVEHNNGQITKII